MADENRKLEREAETVRGLQRTIRRQLDERGISLKAASYDSGIGYSTLLTYFTNERDAKPSALTVAGLRLLLDVIPPDLLSLLLPDGWQIVRAPEGLDHDALCQLAQEYVDAKMRAHRNDSPGGVEVVQEEQADLDARVVALRAA